MERQARWWIKSGIIGLPHKKGSRKWVDTTTLSRVNEEIILNRVDEEITLRRTWILILRLFQNNINYIEIRICIASYQKIILDNVVIIRRICDRLILLITIYEELISFKIFFSTLSYYS